MIFLPLLTIKNQASKIVPVPTYDDLVKSLKTVTPAEAGVQNSLNLLDSRFRGNDKNVEIVTFYETITYNLSYIRKLLGFHNGCEQKLATIR